MPFYFIRHGETEWNRHNTIMGSMDILLNKLGLKQAREAARILRNESFDVIISSPRTRAQQTAEIIAKKLHKPIVFEERLTERVWGKAEGKTFDPTKALCDDTYTPLGAEIFSAFQERVIKTISSAIIRVKRPLIISHGGVFKALAHHCGDETLSSPNCMPFFFKPSEESSHPWLICTLGQGEL